MLAQTLQEYMAKSNIRTQFLFDQELATKLHLTTAILCGYISCRLKLHSICSMLSI